MISETADLRLIHAIQLADSAFPSGVFAFSWGLETALADGQVDARSLCDWIAADLRGRWHPFDRVVLSGGFRLAGPALRDWAEIVDTMIFAERQRQESLQAGGALLASARAIGIATDPVLDAPDAGHFSLVHGQVLAALGLTLPQALAVSVSATARGLLSASVRLGRTGAISMQKHLLTLAPLMARLAASPPEAGTLPASFAPLSEIALMRPAPDRLFIN